MNRHDIPQLAPALERATHALGIWVERVFRDIGLTQAEAHVLAYLARHADDDNGANAAIVTINDLHASFGHKRSTLTSLLDRLEARGWVRRTKHPTSRRLVAVELTDAGQAVGERVSEALQAIETRVCERVGETAIADVLAALHTLEEEMQ
jgi:DNA-binding MarR family transcriptional regulator